MSHEHKSNQCVGHIRCTIKENINLGSAVELFMLHVQYGLITYLKGGRAIVWWQLGS